MRKVFLDNLPKKKNNRTIDWNESIGHFVPFVYDDMKGKIEILNYDNTNRKITTKFNDIIHEAYTTHFQSSRISFAIGKRTLNNRYTYDINDVVKCVTGESVKVVGKIRMSNKHKPLGYQYECLTCGNIDVISQWNLINATGCNVCGNNKILKGYNDVWTTNPIVARLLHNKNRGFDITQYSIKKELFKCPVCNNLEYKVVSNVTQQGFSCSLCSDGVSYPEKITYSLLVQLNLNFRKEKTFEWSQGKRYDFYIPSLNSIIEVHGSQHYQEDGFYYCGGRTLEEEIDNDTKKEQLAIDNGIQHYIVINAKEPKLEHIRSSIYDGILSELVNLECIDWDVCEKYAQSSLVKQSSELWTSGLENANDIAKELKLSRSTIIKYLKIGNKLGWCDYNPKLAMRRCGIEQGGKNGRKIICVTTGEVFNKMKDATTKYNIWSSNLTKCCKGEYKHTGTHPVTGERLEWMYYEEWLEEQRVLQKDKNIA